MPADGSTIIAGDGIPNGLVDSALYSPGAITERGFRPSFCDPATRTADPFLADSCYQIFFQMTIPAASLVLHNATPLTVACTGLRGVPPNGCRYLWNEASLNLYTSDNVLRGLMLPADNGAAHHEISPEPGTLWLLVGPWWASELPVGDSAANFGELIFAAATTTRRHKGRPGPPTL